VYDRLRLAPGDAFAGPAIVESDDTTTVVPIGWHYRIDEYGNGVIERGLHGDARKGTER
jgi:N-methylhydantoinase A/oxoprolinase/acetone carboxylase beta subunit